MIRKGTRSGTCIKEHSPISHVVGVIKLLESTAIEYNTSLRQPPEAPIRPT